MDMSQSPDRSWNPRTHEEAIKYCRKHEISPNELLMRGAKMGSIEEMRIAWLAEADRFERAFIKSTKYGHLSCSIWLNELQEELSLKWEDDVYAKAIGEASFRGWIDVVIWLDSTGKIYDYNIPFGTAAGIGEIGVMDLIFDWGKEVDYSQATMVAVMNDQRKSIKAMKKWNVLKPTRLLMDAALNGSLELMVMAKEWGATNYTDAKRTATRNEKYKAVDLVTRWEKEAANEF